MFRDAFAFGRQVVAIWFHATWCRKCKYIGSRLKYLKEHLPSQLTDRVTVSNWTDLQEERTLILEICMGYIDGRGSESIPWKQQVEA